MKKIVYVILLLLVLGGAVFFIYSRNHSDDDDSQPQYGILNPNGSNGQNGGVINPPPSNDALKDQPKEQPKTEAPRGQVLGEVKPDTAPVKPAPKPVVVAPTPKPATTTVAPVNNGLSTYKISELRFEISVPDAWQPRLETAAGNVLAFYTSAGLIGQIEVIPNAQESFQALTAELNANPNVSNIQQTTIAGQSALIFNDARYGNSKIIAFVYANNVYYLRGANAQQPELGRLKLF